MPLQYEMTAENQLLIFMKYPEEGKVKTRLARYLGTKSAAVLYKRMVMHLMRKLDDTGPKGPFSVRMVFSPPERETDMKNWLGSGRIYMPQRGEDLGERMDNAFRDVFAEGCGKAVIIGCDIPDLSPELIIKAFDSLDSAGAVIGPTLDGGYYLIGFQRVKFVPQIFRGIPWGGKDVFKKTIGKFPSDCNVSILPQLRDLDTFEDLLAFQQKSGHETGPSMQGLFS